MMNIALLDAKKTRSVLKRLIKDYGDIQIAVAWGYNGKLADLLMENSGKFRSVTFGLNGFATSPDLVERLIGIKNAFIAKADNGIFHPKLYLFMAEGKAEAIVGSANFTKGGLDRNYEACVHIEGPADGDMFKQIQRELSGYDVLKQRVTQTLADSYRRQYDAARRQRGQRDPILPNEKNGGKPRPSAATGQHTAKRENHQPQRRPAPPRGHQTRWGQTPSLIVSEIIALIWRRSAGLFDARQVRDQRRDGHTQGISDPVERRQPRIAFAGFYQGQGRRADSSQPGQLFQAQTLRGSGLADPMAGIRQQLFLGIIDHRRHLTL